MQLHDGLTVLDQALSSKQARSCLQASIDVYASLAAESGPCPALADVLACLQAMSKHLQTMAEQHPQYATHIQSLLTTLLKHRQTIVDHGPDLLAFLSDDAFVQAYEQAQKDQDWLGHRLLCGQNLSAILLSRTKWWQELERLYKPILQASQFLMTLLQDYHPWEHAIAQKAHAELTINKHIGLIFIGLPKKVLARGIVPDLSGGGQCLRLRFLQYSVAGTADFLQEDLPYALKKVPIA